MLVRIKRKYLFNAIPYHCVAVSAASKLSLFSLVPANTGNIEIYHKDLRNYLYKFYMRAESVGFKMLVPPIFSKSFITTSSSNSIIIFLLMLGNKLLLNTAFNTFVIG